MSGLENTFLQKFFTARPKSASAKAEIENIKTMREGAFRPWYEWPLLQAFGSFGSIVIMLQYLVENW